MFQLCKRFTFSASHVLDHLPKDHPCARLHGHNYVVEIVVETEDLDERGFAGLDYRDLDDFKKWIDETLDHRHLNDVLPCKTTAENIAKFLFAAALPFAPCLAAVRVSETDKTWATFRQ